MQLSQHAKIRCQQRGIVPFMVDLLYQFGSSLPAGDGTEKLYFDKHGRKKVETYTGGLIKAKASELDIYAIVEGDLVITTGHRTKKNHHHQTLRIEIKPASV